MISALPICVPGAIFKVIPQNIRSQALLTFGTPFGLCQVNAWLVQVLQRLSNTCELHHIGFVVVYYLPDTDVYTK
jgi:hypothetical protein